MSFAEVVADCAKAKKSVVILVKNASTKTLTLATVNLLQGKWQVEPPKIMNANTEHVVAAKTVGMSNFCRPPSNSLATFSRI
jgi:hypothetical protein